MKLVRAILLITYFLLLSIFVFPQSIQDFKGVWQGKYTVHWGANQDTTYNLRIEFLSGSGNQLEGTISIYDNNTPMKLIGTNNNFEVTYNKKDNSFYYDGVTELPDGTRCKGETVYKFMNNSTSIILGTFLPSKKDCVKAEMALMRPDNNNSSLPSQSSSLNRNNTSNQKVDNSSVTISSNVKYIDADKFYNFSCGVAKVQKGTSVAVIDTNGNFIIPYNKYYSIGDAVGGMIVAGRYVRGISETTIFDTKGNIILSGNYGMGFPGYQDGYLFLNDFNTKSFIYINSKGQKYTKPKDYSNGTTIQYRDEWCNGLSRCNAAAVRSINTVTVMATKYGYYNRTGKIIVQPQYDAAEPFSDGFALVGKIDQFGIPKYGFIDTTGRLVIPLMYTKKPFNFSSGLALVTPAEQSEDFLFGYINKKNELVLKYNTQNISAIKEKYNISYSMRGASDFENGFALIFDKVYIDSIGKTYTEVEVEKIRQPFINSFFSVYPPDPVSGYSLAYYDSKESSDIYINKKGIVVMKLKPKDVF